MAVQARTLDVFIDLGTMMGNYRKMLSIFQLNGYFTENGTADCVNWQTRSYRVEAQGGENYECRHATPILVPGNAKNIVLEPGRKKQTNFLLCLPWGIGVII